MADSFSPSAVVTDADRRPSASVTTARRVRSARPEVDTVGYEGGQARYPLLIGVE